jgi:hypothetical protein
VPVRERVLAGPLGRHLLFQYVGKQTQRKTQGNYASTRSRTGTSRLVGRPFSASSTAACSKIVCGTTFAICYFSTSASKRSARPRATTRR